MPLELPRLLTGRTLALSGLGSFLLSLIYTYPLVMAPHEANRFDSPDALLSAWILSWDLHAILNGNPAIFDANIFFPERNTLAYSENLVAAALLVLPFRLFTDNPVLLLNAALVMALVANGISGFALGCLFSRSRYGGALTGLLFAFAPFHWVHIPHLQLQLAFPLPAAFYFARRMRDAPGARPALGLALSIAASFGCSGYYALFLATALPLFVLVDLGGIESERRGRTLAGFVAAASAALMLSLPLLLPYASKMDAGYRRVLSAASVNSATPRAYVTSVSRFHNFLPDEEEPFFPGFAASVLAALAFWRAVRGGQTRHDVLLWSFVGIGGIALSLGPDLGLFTLLHRLGPYQGLRVPARAGILFLLAASVLAGIGLARVRTRRSRLAFLTLAAAECYAGPLPWTQEVPPLPPIYTHISTLEERGALVELPLPPPERFQDNARYVYRSIFHFRPLVNGYSGFVPQSYRKAYRLLMSERFEEGLEHMARLGVRFVVAHKSRFGPRMRRQIEEAERRGKLVILQVSGPDRLYRLEGD
ncbi:MAG TPA: hypothetical protein VLK65_30540 [Vicinamibacteria bacterium]|nr:hypothetical protein [Vicinamibacteria bacterium]